MSNQPSYTGPNFCPNCGCNIRAIGLALQLTGPKPPGDSPAPAHSNGTNGAASQPKARVTTIAKISPETSAEILRLRDEQHLQFAEIGPAVGLSQRTCEQHYYYQRKRERKAIPRSAITPEDSAEIKRRREAGEGFAFIAQAMGRTKNSVQSHWFRFYQKKVVE